MILITKISDEFDVFSNIERGIQIFCRDKIYGFNFIHLFHHGSEYHKIIKVTYRPIIIRNTQFSDCVKGRLYVVD